MKKTAENTPDLLPDDVRFALIGGPYLAPEVRKGQHLLCEMRGMVEVGGWTDAPIPWPRVKKTGTHSPILCGDLVRAVQQESAIAVAHWWGVNPVLVWKWRKTLGVEKTEGTHQLWQAYKPQKLTSERAEKGRTAAKLPENREKLSAAKTGRPADEKTKKALLAAAQEPKSEHWKAQHRRNMKMRWQNDEGMSARPVWTDERLSLLRKLCQQGRTASDMAPELGVTKGAVLSARQRFNIPWHQKGKTMNEDQQKKLKRLMDDAGQKVRLELRWEADALLHQHVMRSAMGTLVGLADEIPEEVLIRRAESVYADLIAAMQKQLDDRTALEIFL